MLLLKKPKALVRIIFRFPRTLLVRMKWALFSKGAARTRLIVVSLFLLGVFAAQVDYPQYWNKGADWLNQKNAAQNRVQWVKRFPVPQISDFRLGLDLQGGAHLVYQADVSKVDGTERGNALSGLRDVIERRVNLFGVTEPVVQINRSGDNYRLIVELAGKDVSEAIQAVGQAPYLDFQEEAVEGGAENFNFKPTGLTGEHLKRSEVVFDPQTNAPLVSLEFNEEGARLFEEITTRNINKPVAILIDQIPVSIPRVEEAISGGRAQITGDFTIEEARYLSRNLNAGSLPVPITLISQQNIGASIGGKTFQQGIQAALWGFILVSIFMVLYYRLPGLLSVAALSLYILLMLLLFKFLSVTITLSGIAGFILSIGMAVDANVLIFERMREEFREGKSLILAIDDGFSRAWSSIWDGNVSTFITAVILFWVGTSFVKGFALTLAIGVLVSMFSAVFATKSLLRLFIGSRVEHMKWVWRA